MNVEPPPRVKPAHVDALDGAGLGALEARLALDVAELVVEQLEPAAEADGDVGGGLGVLDGRLGREEPAHGQRHALRDAEAWDEAHTALTGSR